MQYVIEQLDLLPQVTSRGMFGAIGLDSSGVFFGIVDDDALFFKVDDSTRESYAARGSAPFRPYKDRPELSLRYFQVPVDIQEDSVDSVNVMIDVYFRQQAWPCRATAGPDGSLEGCGMIVRCCTCIQDRTTGLMPT